MKKILVIEENSEELYFLKKVLKAYSFEVETLSNIKDVYAKVYNFNPDLIIMDAKPNGFDGLAITHELKEFSTFNPKVILYTDDKEMTNKIIDFFVTGLLLKPFSVKRLLSEVDKALQISSFSIKKEETLKMVG